MGYILYSKQEADIGIFVESIRKDIQGNVQELIKNVENSLDYKTSKWSSSNIVLNDIINQSIIEKYHKLNLQLQSIIYQKIHEFFQLRFSTNETKSLNIQHQLPITLMDAYKRTQNLASIMENMIDKTSEMTVIPSIPNGFLQKVIGKINLGERLMGMVGLSKSCHGKRYHHQILTTLKGINKNIGISMQNELLRYFTEYIYNLWKNWEETIIYKEVI